MCFSTQDSMAHNATKKNKKRSQSKLLFDAVVVVYCMHINVPVPWHTHRGSLVFGCVTAMPAAAAAKARQTSNASACLCVVSA